MSVKLIRRESQGIQIILFVGEPSFQLSLVFTMLQQRRHSHFDMLSHSIRSSNTLSLGSGKPNCDIWVSLGLGVAIVIFLMKFSIIILLQSVLKAFSIPTINKLRLCMLLWPSGLRRRSVQETRVRSPDQISLLFFLLFPMNKKH